MAGEGGREGPEISRRIRDELERIREAESRVEEALDTVRQARRRVEVAARELAREEERVRAWVRDEIRAATGAPGAGLDGATGAPAEAGPSPTGESAPRSWRTDPGVGWSTWRETAARPRDQGPPPVGEPRVEAGVDAGPAEVSRSTAPEAEPTALPPAAIAVTPTTEGPRSTADWKRHVALGLMVVAGAVVGWFAMRGFRGQPAGDAALAAADTIAPASVAPPTPAPDAPAPAPTSPLEELPQDAAARQALYDSLFAARSPLFDPLLVTIQSDVGDKGVQRALSSWKSGPVDAQDADLIHSALLQHVLKAEIDPRIDVDGQVLRNPCRGRSCTALLDVWKNQQAKYGLPSMPANATTDPRALRQAEAVLVLSWLRDVNVKSAAH